jgi:peptide/nickel transport system substrate-binding protein
MKRLRLAPALLGAAALALVVLATAGAESARYGGTLVVGLSRGDPDSLDPVLSHSISSQEIYLAMCARLYGPGGLPILAAGQPQLSKDKLSETIPLRQGVQFNDGTPFNAQALVANFQRYQTFPGSVRATTEVDSVTASGPYTVVYHLTVPDSSFAPNPWVMSPTAFNSPGANFAANPVCAGPFMFDHRVPGDNVTVTKSQYWYDRGDIHLDKIVFKSISDSAAAVAALESGDIQLLDNVSTSLLPSVRENPNLHVTHATTYGWSGLFINIGNKNGVGSPPVSLGTPLASSPKLRQAFEEAIDRTALGKVVYGGLIQTGCTLIGPNDTQWYAATDVPCTPYDPKDAKQLVATSGYPNPAVHLLIANTADNVRLAQFLQAEEAAVGINVAIDQADNATALARAAAGSFDVYFLGQTNTDTDPSSNFVLDSGDAKNFSGYSNPRLDYVLANALKATTLKARETNYRVAQQIILGDRPIIVLLHTTAYAAYSTSVEGVTLPAGALTVHVEDAQLK